MLLCEKNNKEKRKIVVKKLKEFEKPYLGAEVSYKTCGNIIETVYLSKRNKNGTIKKLNRDEYVLLSTGEIKEFKHKENRSDNIAEVRRSLKRLKDYINTNVTDPSHALWITLTYAENMTNTKRLYTDFDKFMKRFRYRYGKVEYIVAAEPQGRGAWHMHLLLIFEKQPPYIPNALLAEIWGQGFVKINKLKNVDNIGAYLTAYLGDMELSNSEEVNGQEVKLIKVEGKTKRFIKGARLKLYPKGFNLYRISKGIKAPRVELVLEHELQTRTESMEMTFESAIELTLDNGDIIQIYYRYYNALRKRKKKAT